MLKYKIVVFDLDGVIFEKPVVSRKHEEVAVSTWDELFKAVDIYDVHEELKQMFIKKRFKSYIDWTQAACCALKARGLDKRTFDEVITSRSFMAGARETLSALHQADIITGVVSGSFEELGKKAQKELGIRNNILAHSRFSFHPKTGRLESWTLLGTDWKDKVKFTHYVADLHRASLDECVFVGDDVNDIPVLQKAGLGIAFNSVKQSVRDAADVVIAKKDLREILPHVGI